MDILIYITLYIIGTLFGSFYSLAIHRIPKGQDIIKTNSYCPSCTKKLKFIDLIPVFSYVFLGGKCRHCGKKISPRYVILEISFGLIFVAVAYLTKLNMDNITVFKIIEYSFIVLYLTYLALIIGIDKEEKEIQKSVNIYGIIISMIYMVYLYILDDNNIYRYAIYLIAYMLILTLDTIILKKFAKSNYGLGIITMIMTMVIFTGEYVVINSVICTLIAITVSNLLFKIKKNKSIKKDLKFSQKLPIGFYLGVTNIITFIMVLIVMYTRTIHM